MSPAPTHKTTSRILTKPSPDIEIVPRTYTEEEKENINALREYAKSLLLPASDPYHAREAKWLSDPALAERYMRAAKWKLEDAKKRIASTIAWRREYKPDLIPPEEVRIESETGKIILNGFDINGRPIITMHPGRENTKPSDRQLRHLVYILERAIDLMPPGQDSLVIIVDYRSTTLRTNPSISVAGKVLTILQHHYPERLGRAIVVHLPFILQFFYKGISPFLDPVTRDKMRFNPNLAELIPHEHLHVEYGGGFAYEFEPTSYWQDLIKACHVAEDGSRTTESRPEHERGNEPARPINSATTTTTGSNRSPSVAVRHNNAAAALDDKHLLHSPTSSRSSAEFEPRTPANGALPLAHADPKANDDHPTTTTATTTTTTADVQAKKKDEGTAKFRDGRRHGLDHESDHATVTIEPVIV